MRRSAGCSQRNKNITELGRKMINYILSKIVMCMVMKCRPAACHLHTGFTTWQLVMAQLESLCDPVLWANSKM